MRHIVKNANSFGLYFDFCWIFLMIYAKKEKESHSIYHIHCADWLVLFNSINILSNCITNLLLMLGMFHLRGRNDHDHMFLVEFRHQYFPQRYNQQLKIEQNHIIYPTMTIQLYYCILIYNYAAYLI